MRTDLARLSLVLGFLCSLFLPISQAQQPGTSGLTVLILADMEGAMGIADPELLYGSQAHAVYGRELLTREVAAAIRGARGAGASTILFSDSHYQGDNILWGRLASDVIRLPKHAIEGSYSRSEVNGIFERYKPQALILIGYHVMSGGRGFLPHTFTARDYVRINGREVGEIAMLAMLAGEHGVPAVAVSGDQSATEEAHRFIPQMQVAASKRVLDDGSIALEPLDRAADLVERTVRTGVEQRSDIPPLRVAGSQQWEYELRDRKLPTSLPGGVTASGAKLHWSAVNYEDGYWKLFEIYAALRK
jgi:D-amino peptidase